MEHGFFDAPFSLALTTDSPTATIRYTTNGAEPTATEGILYTDPIPIDYTSMIRATAFRFGDDPSVSKTNTYIYTADVIQQPDMDPLIVNDPAYKDIIEDSLKSIGTLSVVIDPAEWQKVPASPA